MLYTLRNKAGMVAKITNYGGIVVSLTAPDRDGNFEDIVLGYDTLAEYEKLNPYFGALIGRYGNRIGKGQFELDGQARQLTTNDGPNQPNFPNTILRPGEVYKTRTVYSFSTTD